MTAAIIDAQRNARLVIPTITNHSAAFSGFVDVGRTTLTRRMHVLVTFAAADPSNASVWAPEHVPDPPHRNPDGSLCLWYPRHSEDQRWVLDDGLGELFLMTSMHLRRERHWQQSAPDPAHRKWPGPEMQHGYPENTP